MTIEEALREASKRVKKVATRPRLEAEIILSYFLDCQRTTLHLLADRELENAKEYFKLVKRREEAEPIEYITGRVSFYDLELEVGPGVLIARPETELLVEKAAEIVGEKKIERVAEIGVGSGAVSIVLARKFPHLHITATDISEKALEYAKKNLLRYGVEDRVKLIKCDLLSGVDEDIELVVSNPPYISEEFNLPDPVKYEPKEALFGGKRGDELLEKILECVKRREIPYIACEMGYDQRKSIEEISLKLGLGKPIFYKDLAGLDRGFIIKS